MAENRFTAATAETKAKLLARLPPFQLADSVKPDSRMDRSRLVQLGAVYLRIARSRLTGVGSEK
jgi:hypothetical protein